MQNKLADFKLRHLFSKKALPWLLAWTIGLATLFSTVGLLSVSGWFISAAAIAGIITGASAISFDFFRPAAIIRAFAIVRTAGRYGERLASHNAVLSLLTDLRLWFFNALSIQKIDFVHNVVGSADTMQRLTHDIDKLDELPLSMWAPWFWALCLQAILIAFMAFYSSFLAQQVGLLLLMAGVAVPAVGVFVGKKYAAQYAVLAAARRRQLINPLAASTSLLLWGKWQYFQDLFHQSDATYNRLHKKMRFLAMLLNAVQQLFLAAAILWLIYLGMPKVSAKVLSVPMLLAFVLAILGMYEVLLPLASKYSAYGFAVASKQRLTELLQKPVADNQTLKPVQTTSEQQLEFSASAVSAKFPNALYGVENVNFNLKQGDILLITGRSGVGKSTLLHALAAELKLNSGAVYINKVEQTQPNYNQLGYLAQELDIFDLTLAENLRLADYSADDAKLWQVLQQVKLDTWAKEQPQQLNTQLGEYGTMISGGQARRIALARLLLKPKSILILDEPFAGLDEKNAKDVFQELKAHQQQGILVLVSHHYLPENVKTLHLDDSCISA